MVDKPEKRKFLKKLKSYLPEGDGILPVIFRTVKGTIAEIIADIRKQLEL